MTLAAKLKLAAMLPLLCIAAHARAATPDQRIEKQLKAASYHYQIDDDGDFKLTFGTAQERSQLVFISSRTHTLGKLEIREIFSPAYVTTEPLLATIARRLLSENEHTKLGAWRISPQADDATAVVFAMQIPAEIDLDLLDALLAAVVNTADEMEQELTGEDEY